MQHEPDDSDDIMCASIIDYYLHHLEAIDHICLAKSASSYTKKGTKRRNNTKPYVIRYVKYNKHKNIDNYYQEKMMLFVPYRIDENTFQTTILYMGTCLQFFNGDHKA